jgi:DNA-binding NtrC family response regulator
VVDDEPNVGMIFHRVLGESGYDVVSAANGNECLRVLKKQTPQLVFLDLRMPGMDGVETLRRIREDHPDLPVLIMTAYQTVSSAVECMKLGAYDYLIKPLDTDRLKSIVKQALEVGEMSRKAAVARPPAGAPAAPTAEVVAEGPAMRRVLQLVDKVSPTDLTVLLLGESGTGKEVVARAVHRRSRRAAGPFVVVDCAALPDSLIESELFGYEKGAFTGADASKPGKFESAHGGTLFLDEIGNLPTTTQAKLLRFLQEPTIERLGGRKGPITLDVRILAATNANLEEAVQKGTFREDLYHRLKVFVVELPPLRDRGNGDLHRLSAQIAEDVRGQFGKKRLVMSESALACLEAYRWPGNIRELQNALRSAALLADEVIEAQHLPMSVQGPAQATATPRNAEALDEVIRRVEKERIRTAWREAGGDLAQAAAALGLDAETLKQKLREQNLL